MRISELRERLNASFGPTWAPSFAKDIVISELGGRTVDEALADGLEPDLIWKAVCKVHPSETAAHR